MINANVEFYAVLAGVIPHIHKSLIGKKGAPGEGHWFAGINWAQCINCWCSVLDVDVNFYQLPT